jgi:hypothetical protein
MVRKKMMTYVKDLESVKMTTQYLSCLNKAKKNQLITPKVLQVKI